MITTIKVWEKSSRQHSKSRTSPRVALASTAHEPVPDDSARKSNLFWPRINRPVKFVEGPPTVVANAQETAFLATPLAQKSVKRIWRYKLLEQIGERGFGVVWIAEQEEPVRPRVIKLGMDTWGTVARFEAERQALGVD